MEVENLIKAINQEGYETTFENNLPIVLIESGKNFDKEVTKISKLLKAIGYNKSFGIRLKKAIENT